MRRELNEYEDIDPLRTVRGIRNGVIIGTAFWALILASCAAFATTPKATDPLQEQAQQQEQAQGQSQDASSTVSTELTANPSYVSSPSYSNRETTIALGSTAPNTVQVSDCIVPARGLFKRGQGWLWGMVQLTPVTETDPACVAAMDRKAQQELDRLALEIRLLEAQNEQERLRIERARLDSESSK